MKNSAVQSQTALAAGMADGSTITAAAGVLSAATQTPSALSGVSAGVATASKAIVVGTLKDIDTLRKTPGTVAAAGTSQATATAITALNDVLYVTAASATLQAVALPTGVVGMVKYIINTSTTAALGVYPVNGGSDAINGLATTVAVWVLPGAVATFICTAANVWFASGIVDQTMVRAGVSYSNVSELNGSGCNPIPAILNLQIQLLDAWVFNGAAAWGNGTLNIQTAGYSGIAAYPFAVIGIGACVGLNTVGITLGSNGAYFGHSKVPAGVGLLVYNSVSETVAAAGTAVMIQCKYQWYHA